MAESALFDIRRELWTRALEQALPFDQYLATGKPAHQERWQAYVDRIHLTDAQRELLGSFRRVMHVLVLSGTWCGDCARQCPMLAAIAAVTPAMKLSFIDSQSDVALRDELRVHGAARVPIAVTLSEDLFEVGRSGDRMLAAYKRKAAQELGAACDAGIVPPSEDELALELSEWVAFFERQQLLLRLSPFLRARHGD